MDNPPRCPGCQDPRDAHRRDCVNFCAEQRDPVKPSMPEEMELHVVSHEGTTLVHGLDSEGPVPSLGLVLVTYRADGHASCAVRGNPIRMAEALAQFLARNPALCDIVQGIVDIERSGRLDGGRVESQGEG